VQVKILNATPNKIVAVPNPSGPIFTHVSAYGHNFSFANNPLARDWVRQDHAGTVITFDLSPPKSADESIDATIKIFDVVGNVVNQADTLIKYYQGLDTTTTIQYNTYWNGSNSQGMRVAPGLYSTAVYLTYHSPTISQKPIKLWGLIGISR
jgi:flagellar hook assembly protein FlgD